MICFPVKKIHMRIIAMNLDSASGLEEENKLNK